MTFVIRYTTELHPEIREFEYYGKNMTGAIDTLNNYVELKKDKLTGFDIKQKKGNNYVPD